MSDTRVLSEKIDEVQAELRQLKAELDKQRTQHARDQKSLHKELEDTRQQAAKLRTRLEKAEDIERGRAVALLAEPSLTEGPGTAANTLVALARPPASVEQALPVLARLLRMSPVDVRLRLTVPQPSILARLPGLEAQQLRDLLAAEGFAVVLAEVPRLVGALTPVRRFTLGEERLAVEDAKGLRQEVPYSELRLMVRGRRKTQTIETTAEMEYERTTHPDRFKGRVLTEEVVKHQHVENFLWVYGGAVRAAFTEATNFAALGAQRGLTKYAALQNLTAELRQRAPRAVVDERLMGPMSLSLPMVGPERSQEVLAGLMDEALQAALWP